MISSTFWLPMTRRESWGRPGGVTFGGTIAIRARHPRGGRVRGRGSSGPPSPPCLGARAEPVGPCRAPWAPRSRSTDSDPTRHAGRPLVASVGFLCPRSSQGAQRAPRAWADERPPRPLACPIPTPTLIGSGRSSSRTARARARKNPGLQPGAVVRECSSRLPRCVIVPPGGCTCEVRT
jgi:hypothetical protein